MFNNNIKDAKLFFYYLKYYFLDIQNTYLY